MKFKRQASARVFCFGDGKKRAPYVVVDVYGQTAALFSDDLAATDWETISPLPGAQAGT